MFRFTVICSCSQYRKIVLKFIPADVHPVSVPFYLFIIDKFIEDVFTECFSYKGAFFGLLY